MEDYIRFIRSKVGQDKIFLTFACGILTNASGEVLLQKRGDNGTWGVVGGCMELGESTAETIIREFKEETGISVHPVELLNIYSNIVDYYPNGDVAQTVGPLYRVVADEPYDIECFRTSETLDLAFFSEEEIRDLPIGSDQHRLMLTEFFNNDYQLGN